MKTKEWVPHEHLKTQEAREAFLEDALAECKGDPTEVLQALGVVARSVGLPKIADDIGVTKQGLYKTFGENGNPNWDTVWKVADAIGFRLTFVPKKVA